MTKYLCILMVLVLCFASTSEAKGGKRPRMLVTPGTLEALRDKAEGAGSDEFAAIKARADAMMNMKAELDNQGRFYLPTYALVYLVTKEEKYASKAKEWFDLLAGHTIRNEWTCLEYIPVSAFAYDWIFPTLTEDEKRRFADGMIRQVERIKKLWRHSDYNNHFLLEHSSQLHVGLTLEGEGHHEDVWRKYLDEGEVWLKNHIVPAMNEMALDDGGCAEGFSYMNWGVERPLALQILAWKTAKGEDLFKKCSFTRWGSRYNIYGRKPNGEMCRTEDCPSGIEWGQQVKGTLSICAAAYGNQYAAWARDSIKAKYPNLSWHHFVPWNPSIQPKSPEGLPLGAVFRGLGHVFTRSSWTDPDSTWGMFQCGPFFAGHQHLDNNSFVIFKRGPLAIESGVNEYSSHRANYYSRTIAHNSVLVFDPDEEFPKSVWSSQGTGGSNDGGQRRAMIVERVTESAKTKERRNIGEILAFENTDSYCYACGDATKSYRNRKMKLFVRHFLHIRPDTFVVCDVVEARKRKFKKTWLLHSIERPELSEEGSSFRVSFGGGVLDVTCLLPKKPLIKTVGGNGSEFLVNGVNYPPDSKKDPLSGSWRVEVSPDAESRKEIFLHVLHASTLDGENKVSDIRLVGLTSGRATAGFRIGDSEYTIVFPTTGKPGGNIAIDCKGDIREYDLATKVIVPEREQGWGSQ